MIEKISEINDLNIINKIPDLLLGSAVFFDIETTGFHKQNCEIILSGLMYMNNDKLLMHQIFMDNNNEKELLEETSNIFNKKNYIVSYNGDAFDIPFYVERCKKNNVPTNIENKVFIDFYKIFNIFRKEMNLTGLKLKEIEKHLKIERHDHLNGHDLIRIYKSFLLNQKKEYKLLIFLHNYEDVLNLTYFFSLEKILVTKMINSKNNSYMPIFIHKKNISFRNNKLFIKAKTYPINKIDYINNNINYNYYWRRIKGDMTFDIFTENYISESGKKFSGIEINNRILPLFTDRNIEYENIYKLIENIINKNS